MCGFKRRGGKSWHALVFCKHPFHSADLRRRSFTFRKVCTRAFTGGGLD